MERNVVVALSSSVTEFHRERVELGDFIRHLNQVIYRRRGIFLDWRVCEDESRSIRHVPRQDEFDGDIRQSRFLFVLIGKKFGVFTEHEFYLALGLFEASKNHPDPKQRDVPQIYPFFTDIPEEEREPRAREFRKKVETEINGGQLTTPFSFKQLDTLDRYALDTLKLYILEEFGRDPFLWVRVTVEEGQARVDGRPVMSVENVPIYAKHEKLHSMKQERAALDKDFAELSMMYHAGNQAAGVERIRVSQERRKLTDEIHKIEEETFKMFQKLAELMKERQTERAEEAARLLSEGEYEQAQAVLKSIRDAEIVTDWEREEQTADLGLEGLRKLIRENRLRIQALQAAGVSTENLSELRECYRKSADAAQKYHIEPEAVFDYALFLRNDHNYPRAIELCEWLEAEYRQQKETPSETWAKLYNLLGMCHTENKNFQKGEKYLNKTLEHYRALAEKDPETFMPYAALVCNNLAESFRNAGRYEEAEPLFGEALEKYSALADDYPNAFNMDVTISHAMTCNNLALLWSETGCYKDAEPLYYEALEEYSAFADDYPDAFNQYIAITCNDYVAMTCNNLANLFYQTGRYAEAEPLYRKALERNRKLAEANPDAFNQYVAAICNNLARLFNQIGRYEKAETLFREALDIYRILAAAYPDAFNQYVARTCNNLGSLFYQTGRKEEAEQFYREALKHYRKLAEVYPNAVNKEAANTCNNLALLLADTDRYEEAEPLYRKALEQYRNLAAVYPDAFNQYVAMTCNNLAQLFLKTGCYAEAEPLCCEALKHYRELAKVYPDAFKQDVAMTCDNLATLFAQTGRKEEAEQLFCEALKHYRKLAEVYPDAISQYIAMTCNNLALLLADTDRYDEAETLFREALEHYRALANSYPDAFNQDVAMTCNNLANLFYQTGHYDEVEPLYREALDIRRKLAEAYPDAFNKDVAATCFNLGIFEYDCKDNPTAAKKYFQEALSLYERVPSCAQEAAQIHEILKEYF